VLARWFGVKGWIRCAIVFPGSIAVGAATDSVDHAFRWTPLPSVVVVPCFAVADWFLTQDRKKRSGG
jgi:hypothetical protein